MRMRYGGCAQVLIEVKVMSPCMSLFVGWVWTITYVLSLELPGQLSAVMSKKEVKLDDDVAS
jgi:hypothetical protein